MKLYSQKLTLHSLRTKQSSKERDLVTQFSTVQLIKMISLQSCMPLMFWMRTLPRAFKIKCGLNLCFLFAVVVEKTSDNLIEITSQLLQILMEDAMCINLRIKWPRELEVTTWNYELTEDACIKLVWRDAL